MFVHNFLLDSAARFPEKVAVIEPKQQATYKEILQNATAIACWLIDQGMQPGERVILLDDKPIEYISYYFGIQLAGGVVVAMNAQTTAKSVKHQVNDCGASYVLTEAKLLKWFQELSNELPTLKGLLIRGDNGEALAGLTIRCSNLELALEPLQADIPQVGLQASDLAQIIYTSGTTGDPNGVALSHANLVANTRSIIAYLHLTDQDRVMAVLPFFYSYGNSLLLTHFAVGGSLVVNQRFLYPNVILDTLVEKACTGFSGVPSTFAILMNRSAIRQYQFPKLRYVTQAGGAMSPTLAKQLKEILPTADVYIMYGQTEASARLSYLEPRDFSRKAGSIGKAIPGVELRVLREDGTPVDVGEVGEIVARGENVMLGYWNNPEKTTSVLRDGVLWTGDLARRDEEGFIYIVSRKSDMIKSGAHRISPKEIEETIHALPGIHEVAVIGMPDEIMGENILACVVLTEPDACSEKEIKYHCGQHLPRFKIPKQVMFVDELPKTPSGKIRKGVMKAQLSGLS